jgi:hypothetical protein
MNQTLLKEVGESFSLLLMSAGVMGMWVGLGLLMVNLLG